MNECNPKDTTATQITRGPDIDGLPYTETDKWSCRVAVVMLQYLSSNTWTDIELAINQVDCNTQNPKFSHKISIKITCN